MHQRVNVLEVDVSAVSLDSAQEEIRRFINDGKRHYVCVAPASTLVDAKRDKAYRDIVNAAAMVTPDGMPVVWLLKLSGCAQVKRTYGPDLMRALCQDKGLRHYFFGGTGQVLARLEECLKKESPGINIVGMFSPAFRPAAAKESQDIIDQINKAKPDILWVGLGSPKQDFWMALNRDALNVPVIIGVGAAFDFLSGTKPQAPRWMGQLGLEWLFRLCCEPKRLWRRYVFGNALFVWYSIGWLLTRQK